MLSKVVNIAISEGRIKYLSFLSASRPSALVQPSELYHLCLMAGLGGPSPNFLEPSLLAQRELLLNVALEHNMVRLWTWNK